MRIVKTFEELVSVIEELTNTKRATWLKRYLNNYFSNMHSVIARLEYTYRIQRVLAHYNVFLSEELVIKMIKGEVEKTRME